MAKDKVKDEPRGKTVDKTVIKGLAWCGPGDPSNVSCVDVKDGRIARIRPLHYDTQYTPEEVNAWRIEKDGHVFEPGFKSCPPPLSIGYKMRAYSPNRILYPMKRVDWDPDGERNPQNRGKSKYVRISWDEATDIIAKEVVRVRETYGDQSILAQYDGHCEVKVVHNAHGNQAKLLSLTGDMLQQIRQPDSWEGWYWGGRHIWGMGMQGMNIYQNNCVLDITNNSDAILYWGADPETTPWGWNGLMPSRVCYWFNEIGVKSIFVCPDVNYAAAVHADKWIPVLPGTDAALQLAIAYVWMTEGMVEKEYLETHADGYDWFEYYVLGHEDGVPKTPEWASEKCGVKSYMIKALARYWGKHKVSVAHCDGGGFIRSVFSHEPARLEVALLGMRGVGQPGVNQFKFLEWNIFGMASTNPLPGSQVLTTAQGAYTGPDFFDESSQKHFVPKTKIHTALLENEEEWYGHCTIINPTPDQFKHFEYHAHDDGPVKPVHMIWSDSPCFETCWNHGYLFEDAILTDQIETVIVQHPWFENQCKMADILLPICTLFEIRDFGGDVGNGQWTLATLDDKAIEQIGESKSDYEAVKEVCKKLEPYGGVYENIYERFTGGRSDEEWIEAGFEQCGIHEIQPEMTFEQFKEQQFWMSPTRENWEEEPAGMIEFYEDPQAHPLETPTGKIEYYSTALAEHFPDDHVRGPVPHWIEETPEHQERISCERAKKYPYLLVTNHPRWRVHAQHDDIPWLREIETCKVIGPDGYAYEPLWVNPVDAAKLGLQSGDVARIYNERGSVLGGVRVTERIMPGAVYQDHGARVDAIVRGTGGLDRGGANNLISPTATSSKNCAGEVTNSYLVGVEKVDVFELAKKYPEEFSGRSYSPDFGQTIDSWIVEGE